MVKSIILSLCSILFSSCHNVQFNEYGVLKRFKDEKIIKIPDSVYQNLDTLTLYKRIKYKSVGDFFTPKEDSFLRFYGKGKIISYRSQIPLSREYFRPERGIQGSYFVKKNKLHCSFYNYPYGASGIIFFKKDTLINEVNRVTYFYVKLKNVDPEWLNWKPDW